MKKITSVIWLVIPLMMFAALINCGKKGPLKLDPPVLPGKVLELDIVQVGDDLRFSWKFPEFLEDRQTPMALSEVRKMFIHMSDRPHIIKPDIDNLIDPKKSPESDLSSSRQGRNPMGKQKKSTGTQSSARLFLKKSRVFKKFEISVTKKEKGVYQFTIPGISSKFLNKKVFLALNYRYKRLTSALSEVKEIRIMHPLSPVSDLEGLAENKVIKLKWSYSPSKIKGMKTAPISGFNVFRKVESDGSETAFKKINKDTVLKEYFEDSDTGVSGEYHYYVSVVNTKTNISKNSNKVSMNIKDIFPPEIPGNLHLFKSKDGFMLSWKEVKDKDLSHYKIYRKDGKTQSFTLLADEVKDNRFLDKSVKKGAKYIYVITSVDNNGNESDNSVEGTDQF